MAKLKPAAVYLLLLAVQMTGALFFISKELPDFRQLLLYPGEQLPYLRGDDFAMMVALVAMQVAYWSSTCSNSFSGFEYKLTFVSGTP
jgi:hypothetical protein